MPFVAKHKDSGERIDITQLEQPKAVLKSGDCVCQLCGEPLIVKDGWINQAHFAHYVACASDYEHKPESPEHHSGKLAMVTLLRARNQEYADAVIELEVCIPEIKRVADVLVTYRMGWREAHEIQLSPITVEKLNERTDDYLRAGIDVFWWFGPGARSDNIRDWTCENNGECYYLDMGPISPEQF
jgi:competence CoiA-like predicted nuclease